jgi:hypothetical protein
MPISDIWTLVDNTTSTSKLVDAWGISRAVLTRVSQAPDKLAITVSSAKFDDAPLFAFGDSVTLLRYNGTSNVTWFTGKCITLPRSGRPNAESMDYEFLGPWDDLDNIVYQQPWTAFAGGTLSTAYQACVNLFSNVAGALITTEAQINDALMWATGAGAALTIGALPTGIEVPTEQGTALTVAEVVKRALRWHPDAVTWFDYTTSPPTLNIGVRGSATGLSLAIAGAPAAAIDIQERYDLLHPVVQLQYQQVNTVNGVQQLSQLAEQYPAGSTLVPRALIIPVTLAGSRTTFLSQVISAAAIPSPTTAAWWKAHLPELSDASIASLSVDSGSDVLTALNDDGTVDGGGTVYANELLDGAIAAWIDGHTQPALITAKITYAQTTTDVDGNVVTRNITSRVVSVRVITTDVSAGTYYSMGTTLYGDIKPTGLAANYYAALNQLQYEGEFSITEVEVGTMGGPYAGYVLNLTGGVTAWATMNAQVQQITEDIATGKTTFKFGPHKLLSPADLIAHLTAARNRVIPELVDRATGVVTGGEQDLPGKHKKHVTGKVETTDSMDVAFVGTDSANYKVTMKPTSIPGGSLLPVSNLTMTPKVLSLFCTSTGLMTNYLVLMSEGWT